MAEYNLKYVSSHIRRLHGYVPGEQPQQGSLIKLNTNENPYPPSPRVIEAIQAAAISGLQKYPDPMANRFRLRAAELLGVPSDWILCGNGSDDLLTIITRTFVASGQFIRMPRPSYTLYQTLAGLQEAQTDVVDFLQNWLLPDSFFQPTPHIRLCFLPNPNSPSGTWIPSAILREQIPQMNAILVLDEAYVDFADHSGLDLLREFENIIITRSLSKSYALAGLRFGFAIARPELIEQMAKVKDSYNCDTLSIAAATAAIDDQAWLIANRNRIRATRTRLTNELRTIGFRTIDSQANFVWSHHPQHPSRDLYQALKERGILVRYMNYPDSTEGLRISVGTDEQIDRLLAELKSLVG